MDILGILKVGQFVELINPFISRIRCTNCGPVYRID